MLYRLAGMAALITMSGAALANLSATPTGWTGSVFQLARTDARLITRTAAHRADAPSCQAVSGKQLVHALYSCLPLLEIYRAAEPLRPDISSWGLLRDADSRESRAFERDWQHFLGLAEKRIHPAGDVALVRGHLIRSDLFTMRGDKCRASAELDAAIAVIASSRITDPDFDIRARLQERRRNLSGRE